MRLDAPFRQPQGVLGFAHKPRRSRGSKFRRAILLLLVLAGGFFFTTWIIPQGSSTASPVNVVIPKEVPAAVDVLTRSGVLQYPRSFSVLLTMSFRQSDIKPGSYTISPHLSMWSLAKLITTTRPRPEREITVIEGWDLRNLGDAFARAGIASQEELYGITGAPGVDYRSAEYAAQRPRSFDDAFSFLKDKPEFIGLEGYLFPDTYRVYADATAEDVVKKMLANFDRKITPELREEIARSGRTLHQIITMASIIEAEARGAEDRSIVAGIFWKRRDRGMLLQADSTVNYVTGKHDARVSRNDTLLDSAYNTYRYAGLPRGPINNPGMDAIVAALRPKQSPYWFFLTMKEGKVIYARTLEEHNENVAKYLNHN